MFFTETPYSPGSINRIYAIDINSDNIISASHLFLDEDGNTAAVTALVREYAETHGIEMDIAYDLIDETLCAYDLRVNGEMEQIDEDTQVIIEDGDLPSEATLEDVSWDAQIYAAKIARVLGYEAAMGDDEQGLVYMIDMLNRDSELLEQDLTIINEI